MNKQLTAQQLLAQGFKDYHEEQEQLNRDYLSNKGYTDEQIDAGADINVSVDELAKQEREKERAEAYMRHFRKSNNLTIEKSKRIKNDYKRSR